MTFEKNFFERAIKNIGKAITVKEEENKIMLMVDSDSPNCELAKPNKDVII